MKAPSQSLTSLYFLLTIFIFLSISQQAAAQFCVPPPAGQTNWYPGEGRAIDTVSGADGTLVNGALADSGYKGSGFNFDGVDDYVSLPGTFGGIPQLTVEAWVKTGATSADFQAVLSSTAHQYVHLQLIESGGNIVVYTDTGGILFPIITQSPLNVWRHIALTAKSGDSRLYINGMQIARSTQPDIKFEVQH